MARGNRIHHTVTHVILQDHLAGIIQSRPDSRQLDQHIGAILSVLHHPTYLFQMADGP